jgi:hypothetical protein
MSKRSTLSRIVLTLARSKNFPEGSTRVGYEMVAPLTSDGFLDSEKWKETRADCTVRHFNEGKEDATGMLVHKAGGKEHGRWIFDYDFGQEDDDEAGYLFGSHPFVPGEYVSVQNADGRLQTFKVAEISPLGGS